MKHEIIAVRPPVPISTMLTPNERIRVDAAGEGWYRAIQRQALSQLAIDLSGVPQDCWLFFEALFTSPSRVATVRLLADELDVLPSTLMSRFFRARLPAPKQYLASARLVRAARIFENP